MHVRGHALLLFFFIHVTRGPPYVFPRWLDYRKVATTAGESKLSVEWIRMKAGNVQMCFPASQVLSDNNGTHSGLLCGAVALRWQTQEAVS